MGALYEITVEMTTDERSTVMEELDVVGHTLSAAARAALLSAAPDPIGLPAGAFTCTVGVTRELSRRTILKGAGIEVVSWDPVSFGEAP